MTPDTTTATAAMSELLRKNPRPWSVWVSPNARQLVDATDAPISLNDLCAAVNATGTGERESEMKPEWVKQATPVSASGKHLAEMFEKAFGHPGGKIIAHYREDNIGKNRYGEARWRDWRLYECGGVMMFDEIDGYLFKTTDDALRAAGGGGEG